MLTSGDFTLSLPHFDYVVQKNDYSGSFGRFRFKMFPSKNEEEENIIIAAVYRDRAFELEREEGRTQETTYPYSEEGIQAAEHWIMERYEEMKASGKLAY